ncbi:MAG: thiamine pyrophosphate-binding protein [Rhodospirillaceae bacterium]|nr:thiamine pyrophosphate-binding protein [Rhodospirillaceae bacterium]
MTESVPPAPPSSVDWAADAVAALRALDVRQVAYVPDAGLTRFLELSAAEDGIAMTSVATEEDAIALTSGAWLGGQRAIAAMQSSGVGNIPNMLTLPRVCRMPLLMLVTMRGEPGETNPWQESTGRAVPALLEAMGVEVRRVESASGIGLALARAGADAFGGNRQICVQIAQSVIGFKGFQGQGEGDAPNPDA